MVVVILAGNYNAPDQWKMPLRLMTRIVIPSHPLTQMGPPPLDEALHRLDQPVAVFIRDHQRQRHEAALGDVEALLQKIEKQKLFQSDIGMFSSLRVK